MILYSPAKINLGLQILKKREDGFHDISTVMLPIPFRDIIEINHADKLQKNFSLTQSGIIIQGAPKANLCYKAWEAFSEACKPVPVKIHVHKSIPSGAGLGGGSSNAATVLKGLNTLSDSKLKAGQLREIASELGSDCPVFIDNQPALAEGRGEKLHNSPVNLEGSWVVLLHSGIMVNTAWAYGNCAPEHGRKSLIDILKAQPDHWSQTLFNDFEPVVFKVHPELAEMKELLYKTGAFYASMSGSGSSVYGLFHTKPELSPEINKNLVWSGTL